MNRPTRDSVAGRAYLDLQNQARRQQRTTQELLTLYVLERWLARMSRSSYADDFILKGGMLLAAFGTRRPTVDADTLAQNMASDHETVAQRVSEIATMKDPSDGVTFLIETITIKEIRQEALYAGVRVTMVAQLASAEVKLRLDINFGDPVTPAPRSIELPALRAGFESIHILGYPIETVLAEKVVTALELGLANTRVRDFADIYLLSRTQTLKFDTLRDALMATAKFRGTSLRALSTATEGLGELRNSTYAAFRKSLGQRGEDLPEGFSDAIVHVADFIDPVLAGMDSDAVWSFTNQRWESS